LPCESGDQEGQPEKSREKDSARPARRCPVRKPHGLTVIALVVCSCWLCPVRCRELHFFAGLDVEKTGDKSPVRGGISRDSLIERKIMKTRLKMIASLAILGIAGMANAQTFTNPTPITLTDTISIAPYPSTLMVSGIGVGAFDMDVRLNGLSHTFPSDLDFLLVGPGGTTPGNITFMSDIGGGTDVTGITLTFSDGAPAPPAVLVTGTFAPTNIGAVDAFPAPAPAQAAGSSLNAMADALDPINGVWSLYISDDAGADAGSLSGGWSLIFSPVPSPGALALLGFAGLVGNRRRRRA